MREIIFRGYQETLKIWVYGYLVKNSKGKCFIIQKEFRNTSPKVCDVIPESVGQLTGAKINFIQDIFEGDILKVQLPMGGFWGKVKTERIGKVIYDDESARFIVEWSWSKNQPYIELSCDIAHEAVILGNVFQNPEIELYGQESKEKI